MELRKERAMIFIDARNLIGGEKLYNHQNQKNHRFGYKELMAWFGEKFHLIRGYYYDGAPHPTQRTKDREKLYHFIRQQGITLRLKEIDFQKKNPSQKGVDIYLASDMISLAYENAYDTAIIVSGDGDYHALIELVKSKGKKVWILSYKVCLSGKLRECADKVLLIENIPELQRTKQTSHNI